MSRLARYAGGLAAAIVIAPFMGTAVAHAATAETDSDCATQPASVPAGYECLILDEPSGNNTDLEGETWWDRSGDNHLLIQVFALDTVTEVQVCARDTAAYDPVNGGASEKCAGDSADRVYSGTDTDLDLDLDGFVDPEGPLYFVIHVNQGNKTTTSQNVGEDNPEVVAPNASIEGDCDSAVATLDAGTPDDTTFTVTRTGEPGTDVEVPAGTSDTFEVDLDAAYPTVTVTVGSDELASYTRVEEDCVSGNEDVRNPAVHATKRCGSGISVELSNMDATVPVTFTVTAPDGSSEDVTVNADAIAKRSYKVAEDSTGVVTVTAPGIAEKTVTYEKDCADVLGTKTVKNPPKTEPDVLPFTGSDTAGLLAAGALSLLTGTGLVVAARRRRGGLHAA
jgi:LPXTG-motif cell wall-anchored protein